MSKNEKEKQEENKKDLSVTLETKDENGKVMSKEDITENLDAKIKVKVKKDQTLNFDFDS